MRDLAISRGSSSVASSVRATPLEVAVGAASSAALTGSEDERRSAERETWGARFFVTVDSAVGSESAADFGMTALRSAAAMAKLAPFSALLELARPDPTAMPVAATESGRKPDRQSSRHNSR